MMEMPTGKEHIDYIRFQIVTIMMGCFIHAFIDALASQR
jgi:hypothetical protein